MIEHFYKKIHTIFDGLQDTQKVEIYNQMGAKLMKDNLLPAKTGGSYKPTKTGKRFSKTGYVSFKHITGFNKAKPPIARIEGTMVKDYNTVDEDELILIMKDKKYVVCVTNAGHQYEFEGDTHMGLQGSSPEFNSPDSSPNWRALNIWVAKVYE
tara:strand:+ start:204 stop:665 length:462 start_codon:yes stop_codon:yes gene_type:complete